MQQVARLIANSKCGSESLCSCSTARDWGVGVSCKGIKLRENLCPLRTKSLRGFNPLILKIFFLFTNWIEDLLGKMLLRPRHGKIHAEPSPFHYDDDVCLFTVICHAYFRAQCYIVLLTRFGAMSLGIFTWGYLSCLLHYIEYLLKYPTSIYPDCYCSFVILSHKSHVTREIRLS